MCRIARFSKLESAACAISCTTFYCDALLSADADACHLFCYLLCLQQSILDMEVNELLVDGGNEAPSGEEPEARALSSAVVNAENRTPSLGNPPPDATKRDGFTADCRNVPLSSHDGADDEDDVEMLPVIGDPDIFLYMALAATVAVMVSALYTQVVNN